MSVPLLDFEALKDLDSLIRTNDSNQFYFRQSEIQKSSPIYVRLLLPHTYSGRWFLQTFDHWFKLEGNDKKTKVSSPIIAGEADYIDSVIEQIKRSADPSANALIKNEDYYSKQQSFIFSCLILENVKYDNTGKIADYTVKNNKPCVFSCSPQILKAITNYVVHPQFNRPSGKSIADLENGVTLTISKDESGTGAKKKIDYKVIAVQQPHPVSAEYEAQVENLLEQQKRQMYSDVYMHSVVTHLLTGRPTLQEPIYRYPELRTQRDTTDTNTQTVPASSLAFTVPAPAAPVFAAPPAPPAPLAFTTPPAPLQFAEPPVATQPQVIDSPIPTFSAPVFTPPPLPTNAAPVVPPVVAAPPVAPVVPSLDDLPASLGNPALGGSLFADLQKSLQG